MAGTPCQRNRQRAFSAAHSERPVHPNAGSLRQSDDQIGIDRGFGRTNRPGQGVEKLELGGSFLRSVIYERNFSPIGEREPRPHLHSSRVARDTCIREGLIYQVFGGA